MIKIIHFVPSINCTSGIMQLIMNYFRLIDKKKFEFDFIYFIDETENNFIDEIKKLGGNSYKICRPTNYFRFKNELTSILKKCSVNTNNLIFHNHQIAFTVFLRNITKKCGIDNFIVHNHMSKYSDKLLSSIRNYFLCIPIKYLKIDFFACSEEAAKLCYGKNEPFIMKNGINVKSFLFNEKSREKYRNDLRINKDDFVIGHIGHFENVKNHKFIFDLFINNCLYNEKVKLLLVGSGSLKQNFIHLAEINNICERVIFLENRNDIPNLLSAMDLFVFPSKHEGLGIAAVEAQASGLPVIISDKVPKDVIINNCISANINDKIIWINKIDSYIDKKISYIDRKKSNDLILESMFNIHSNIKKLEDEYIRILKKEKNK